MSKIYKLLAHNSFMNIFKFWKLKKELIRKDKIDKLLDDQIIQAMEKNKELEKTAQKTFKLRLLEAQQQETLKKLGVPQEKEQFEEEEEEEEENDNTKALRTNLLMNSLNKGNNGNSAPSTPEKEGILKPIKPEDFDKVKLNTGESNNGLEQIINKVRSLPPEIQEKIINTALDYLD